MTTLNDILQTIAGLIDLATPIVVALALLYFFWGLAQYILNAGDENKKKEGREIMIWGIIALFVMVSIWGIVNVIQDTFDLRGGTIEVPQVETNNR
ncbi:MAG: pilin [Patescibacteria group bacterium UBA2163]